MNLTHYNYIPALKTKLIEILRVFDEFCREYNLTYFASGGTAIGAVRHHGFIPWDDDIDVYMFRPDYERLIENRDKLPVGYKLSTLGDDNYIYPFTKLCDENTTLVEHRFYPNCIIGVFIDIFPLDEVTNDVKKVEKDKETYMKYLRAFQNTYRKFTFRYFASLLFHSRFSDAIDMLLSTLFRTSSQKRSIRNAFIKYENDWAREKGDFVMIHQCIYEVRKEIFPREWFSAYEYLPFENYVIRVCVGKELYLTQLFGDYMTPPPVEQQQSHHSHYYLNLKEGLSKDAIKNRIRHGEYLVF